MENKSTKLKDFIYAAFIAFLIIMFIQSQVHFLKKGGLKGDVQIAKPDTFSMSKWFSGSYQSKTDKYLDENFGFRDLFVRLNNQIDYSLFNKIHADDVVVGKDRYLFISSYIKAYYGNDFIGENAILSKIRKIKFLQDTLSRLGKTLIVVFEPSKANYYPDFIPDSFRKDTRATNYDTYVKMAKNNGVNYIDFNRYFMDHKYQSQYPLYSKYGIHWTFYGACLVTDSLIKYIDKARNIRMPEIRWDKIHESYKPESYDYDIADGMNLLLKFRYDEKLGYPIVQFREGPGYKKPSLLAVGDSYFFGISELDLSKMFSDYHFLYYNNTVFPESEKKAFYADQLNLKVEIMNHDVIMIMATTSTINDMGWGFIEKAYKVFKKKNSRYDVTDLSVISQRDYIKTDKNWMAQIVQKAKSNHISIDSMITLDAIYVKELDYQKKVNDTRNFIKTDTNWMKQIEQKAKDRKIPVDSMITLDAIWATD